MKSDNDLRYDIHAELLRQLSISAEKIDVQVLDGVVTLTGRLESDLERWRVDDTVRAMTGVKGLIDQTMVAPEAPRASPNPDTARSWFPGG